MNRFAEFAAWHQCRVLWRNPPGAIALVSVHSEKDGGISSVETRPAITMLSRLPNMHECCEVEGLVPTSNDLSRGIGGATPRDGFVWRGGWFAI